MGQGIQQAPAGQSSTGNPFTDVFNVLFEPTAVFDRVRERPNFFAPYLAIMVVQCILFFVNLSYLKVAVQAQIAAAGSAAQSRPMPGTALLAVFGILGLVIVLSILLLVTGLLLWVLASVLGGGEAKFSTMLSVATYSAIPSAILLSIVGTLVLHLQGTGQITSPQDLQPALGLDLLAPAAKGFMGALLKGINPFSVWAVVLTGIGVSTTQRTSKSSGYTIAVVAFVIMLLIGSGLAALSPR